MMVIIVSLSAKAEETTNGVNHLDSMPAFTDNYSYSLTPTKEDESGPWHNGICNHYVVHYKWDYIQREVARHPLDSLRASNIGSLSVVGHNLRITQGPVPMCTDPMQSASDKELQTEKYRRVELVGNGNGVFISEAEGIGCHVSQVTPDAAVFVQASGNSVGVRFSTSFDKIPFLH
jgi:hypothetical protein